MSANIVPEKLSLPYLYEALSPATAAMTSKLEMSRNHLAPVPILLSIAITLPPFPFPPSCFVQKCGAIIIMPDQKSLSSHFPFPSTVLLDRNGENSFKGLKGTCVLCGSGPTHAILKTEFCSTLPL